MSEDNFYQSKPWKRLREKVLLKWPRVCMKCKSKDNIEVDHVLPRSIFPSLALSFSNMGLLCKKCNQEKSARIIPDYRPKRIIYYFRVIIFVRLAILLIVLSATGYASLSLDQIEVYLNDYNQHLSPVLPQ